jgi:hypothetical protein
LKKTRHELVGHPKHWNVEAETVGNIEAVS